MTIANGPSIEGIGRCVSRLALGTAFYRLDSQETWFSILDGFLEQGGTLIDTARDYGESEMVIGRWMESRNARDRIVLATKGGQGGGHGLTTSNFAETLRLELGRSLDCLKTDHVDLYWLHRDSPDVPVDEIMDCLCELVRDKTVRALGASNWRYERIAAANEYARQHGSARFSAVSNHISLAVPERPFYPGLVSVDQAGERWHQQTGTPLIPWSAQARGFFTGRYTPALRAKAHTLGEPFTVQMLQVYGTDANFERLQRAMAFGAGKGGYTATEIALAWLFQKPFPVVPIVGPRTTGELLSCCRALSVQMSQAEAQWLDLAGAGRNAG